MFVSFLAQSRNLLKQHPAGIPQLKTFIRRLFGGKNSRLKTTPPASLSVLPSNVGVAGAGVNKNFSSSLFPRQNSAVTAPKPAAPRVSFCEAKRRGSYLAPRFYPPQADHVAGLSTLRSTKCVEGSFWRIYSGVVSLVS